MPDIDSAIVVAGAKVVGVGGHDYRAVLDDLGFAPAELRKRQRVSWKRYVGLTDRMCELAGSEAEVIRWAKHYAEFTPAPVRAMFAATLTPRSVNKLGMVVLRQYYPPLDVMVVRDEPAELSYAAKVRPNFCGARLFFLMNVGAIAGTTRYLGLPDQEVTWDVSDRFARYTVRYPRTPTMAQRTRAVLDQFKPSLDDGSLLEFAEAVDARQSDAPPEAPRARSLRLAEADWGLTPRQVEVLGALVDGAGNKEIAEELGCSGKTVEHHMTAILKAAGCESRSEVVSTLWALSESYTSGKSHAAPASRV